MNDPRDPSIRNEPFVRGDAEVDPSEAVAARRLAREEAADDGTGAPDASVWDEPALSPELAGTVPVDQRSYAQWLKDHLARVSPLQTWWITLGVVLVTGPWAVLAAVLREATAGTGKVVGIVVIAPIVEELMKVSMPLMIVETRPYLFRSKAQIVLAAIAGGMVFGALENLLYFNVYIDDPEPALMLFRWAVCMPGHTIWSLLAGIGVARMWQHSVDSLRRPDMTLAAPWLIAAMIFHGLYNGTLVALSMVGWLVESL